MRTTGAAVSTARHGPAVRARRTAAACAATLHPAGSRQLQRCHRCADEDRSREHAGADPCPGMAPPMHLLPSAALLPGPTSMPHMPRMRITATWPSDGIYRTLRSVPSPWPFGQAIRWTSFAAAVVAVRRHGSWYRRCGRVARAACSRSGCTDDHRRCGRRRGCALCVTYCGVLGGSVVVSAEHIRCAQRDRRYCRACCCARCGRHRPLGCFSCTSPVSSRSQVNSCRPHAYHGFPYAAPEILLRTSAIDRLHVS